MRYGSSLTCKMVVFLATFCFTGVLVYASQRETLIEFTTLKKGGKTEEAIALMKSHLEAESEWYYGNLYLGKLYYDLERIDESLPYLEKAKELNPSSFGPAGIELGKAYLASGENEKAIRALEEAREFLLPEEKERVDMELWKVYYECGDYHKALSYFEKFTYRFRDSYEDMKMAGEMYLKLGKELEAKDAYRRALELNPGDVGIKRALADLYLSSSSEGGLWEKKEALNFWKELPEEEKTPEVLEKLGNIAVSVKDEECARECFGKLLEVDPENCSALLWSMNTELDECSYRDALTHARKVVQYDGLTADEKAAAYIIAGRAHWGLAKEKYKKIKGADLSSYKSLRSEYFKADGDFRKADELAPSAETKKLIKENAATLSSLNEVVQTIEKEIKDQKRLEAILAEIRRQLE